MYIYLIIVNILTFILFGLDKKYAIKNKWRIKEFTLFLLCFIGGVIGGMVGMRIFHHKTNKNHFLIGLPLILIIHLIIYSIYLQY